MKFIAVAVVILSSTVALAHGAQPMCGDGADHPAGDKKAPAVFNEPQKVGTKVSCPVSGELFNITAATAHVEYKGKHVYFCCPGCTARFNKDPEKYLARNS